MAFRSVVAFVLLLSFVFSAVVVVVVDAQAPTPLASAHPFACWGAAPTPAPSTAAVFTELALGNFHVCGLDASAKAQCWGQNAAGQQNLSTSTSGLEFARLAAGFTVSCGILSSDITARCYGTDLDNRTAVPTGVVFTALAMRTEFGCALSGSGAITCWGKNDDLQTSSRPSGDGFTQVVTGYAHACALNVSGHAQCWGQSAAGATSPPAETFRSLCAGADMTCGLTLANSFPVCWGSTASTVGTPTATYFDSIACGTGHVCGIADGSTVQCWGGGTTDAKTPPAGFHFAQIYGGLDYTCGLYVPSPSPSVTPSPITPTPSRLFTTTPSAEPSETPALTLPPTPFPTLIPTLAPTLAPSAPSSPSTSSRPSTPSASRNPSVSPTAMPVVSPLAANASASFGESEPTVDLSAPSNASSSSVGVRSSLQLVQLGNTTVPGIAWAASNGSGSGAGRRYEAQLDAATNATQEFAFSANASSASFSGLEFVIAAGSIKWSLNFTSDAAATQGVTLRYRLSDLANASATGSPGRLAVVRRADNTPRANMTSYYLAVPSAATSSTARVVVMVVEVFDVALVDDAAFVSIAHAVDVASDSDGDHYELVLAFPAFNRSLFYDPSIGLGVLLGSSGGRDSGGSGGDDLGLIVGVVVAVSVAAVVVVAVIVAGVALAVWRKRRGGRFHADMVHFDNPADEGQL